MVAMIVMGKMAPWGLSVQNKSYTVELFRGTDVQPMQVRFFDRITWITYVIQNFKKVDFTTADPRESILWPGRRDSCDLGLEMGSLYETRKEVPRVYRPSNRSPINHGYIPPTQIQKLAPTHKSPTLQVVVYPNPTTTAA